MWYRTCIFLLIGNIAYGQTRKRAHLQRSQTAILYGTSHTSATSHLLKRAPLVSRLITPFMTSKPSSLALMLVAVGATKAFAKSKKQTRPGAPSESIEPFAQLQQQLTDQLKRPQSAHLIKRGYPALAPTTASAHFEFYNAPERLLVQHAQQPEQFKKNLAHKIDTDYFNDITYFQKRLAQLQEEQQQLQAQPPPQ